MDHQASDPKKLNSPGESGIKTVGRGAWSFSKDFMTGLITLAIAIVIFVILPPLFMVVLKVAKWAGIAIATLLLLILLTALVGRVVNWLFKSWAN